MVVEEINLDDIISCYKQDKDKYDIPYLNFEDEEVIYELPEYKKDKPKLK